MSRYIEKTIGDKNWNFRLTTLQTVELEKSLKQNPVSVLFEMQNGGFPQVTKLVEILFYSLKTSHPTIKKEKVYEIVDKMYDEGGNYVSIVNLILEIFRQSGLLPEDSDEDELDEEEAEEKNV